MGAKEFGNDLITGFNNFQGNPGTIRTPTLISCERGEHSIPRERDAIRSGITLHLVGSGRTQEEGAGKNKKVCTLNSFVTGKKVTRGNFSAKLS